MFRSHAAWLATLADEMSVKYPDFMPLAAATAILPELDNVRAASAGRWKRLFRSIAVLRDASSRG